MNSPGEVATWLTPVVAALREEGTAARLTAFILPCTYASGAEEEVVREIPGIDIVVGTGESLMYALFGRRPRGWRPAERGALLFLGGEFMLAARIVRRTGYLGAAYTEGYINHAPAFRAVFVPREGGKERLLARGVDEASVETVGDLMVDAAHSGAPGREEARKRLGIDPGAGPVVALFPGSRPFEIALMLKHFVAAAWHIRRAIPSSSFVAAISPFTSGQAFADAVEEARGSGIDIERGQDLLRVALVGEEIQIRIVRGRSREVISASDLALTVPGSNTAEMAALGLPMIVCVSLERPEEVPLEGIPALIERVPLIGRRLKAKAVLAFERKLPFVALPNRIAGRAIVPEIRGERVAPEDIARQAVELLSDEPARVRIGRELREAMGPAGAAARIARRIASAV